MVGGATDKENGLGFSPGDFVVLLGVGDELLGEALGFFGLGPGRVDGLVLDQRGDEVAEEGFAVGRVARELAVFHVAACHGGLSGKERDWGGLVGEGGGGAMEGVGCCVVVWSSTCRGLCCAAMGARMQPS